MSSTEHKRAGEASSGWNINIQLLLPGAVIYYKLAPSQEPSNPDKLWKGKIIHRVPGGYHVESLEDGYMGEREHIEYSQVVSIESQEEGI